MPGAAGRVEHAQVARVLLRARRELLVGLADQVLAPLGERGLRAAHLVPDAAERVVGEELDDVARREELVAHGQLAAVARRLALLAHLPALVLAVEELVDPADGLVLAPHAGELGGVQDRRGAARTSRASARARDAGSRRSKRTFTSVDSSSKSTRCRGGSPRCRAGAASPGAMPQNSR